MCRFAAPRDVCRRRRGKLRVLEAKTAPIPHIYWLPVSVPQEQKLIKLGAKAIMFRGC
jgi:hypothetical protein